jgi:hypothetical protein
MIRIKIILIIILCNNFKYLKEQWQKKFSNFFIDITNLFPLIQAHIQRLFKYEFEFAEVLQTKFKEHWS